MPTATIRLLPDALANQIAAGEVIQRPASVVKELVENAVDAGSKHIKVVIKDAGKTLIQVIDDGIGMSTVDARMSLEKHATSKITHADDLFGIATMGFRGEALPSIAAVSQLEIETRTHDVEVGTRLIIEASITKSQEPVAVAPGTTVTVKNLFFNVPARRNFLKADPIETKHIVEEFQHIALARPDIAFSLYQNGQETYHLPIAKLAQRIIHLLGEGYKKQLIPCQGGTDIIKIEGYVGDPSYVKKTRGEQFFFVNKRFIKSNYLHHAIKAVYDPFIPKDTFPFYVLFIDIPPQRVDVNVHPTKIEIKFDDERSVYAILQATVQQALAQHTHPSLDFEQPTNKDPLGLEQFPSARVSKMETNYAKFKTWEKPVDSQTEWNKLLEKMQKDPPTNPPVGLPHLLEVAPPSLAHNPAVIPSMASNPGNEQNLQGRLQSAAVESLPEKQAKMQLCGTYILASVKSGLLLIDQQAAHERILYERYIQQVTNHTGVAQQLLFPEQIDLNPADFDLLQAHSTQLADLGFNLEVFSRNTLILLGYPDSAKNHNPKQLLEALLEQIKWNQIHLSLPIGENIARALAKQTAIPVGKRLLIDEMDSLVDQLFACSHTIHTPEGKLIWTIIPLVKLETFLHPKNG
jgi:DNA mismatch repair protein MutL